MPRHLRGDWQGAPPVRPCSSRPRLGTLRLPAGLQCTVFPKCAGCPWSCGFCAWRGMPECLHLTSLWGRLLTERVLRELCVGARFYIKPSLACRGVCWQSVYCVRCVFGARSLKTYL